MLALSQRPSFKFRYMAVALVFIAGAIVVLTRNEMMRVIKAGKSTLLPYYNGAWNESQLTKFKKKSEFQKQQIEKFCKKHPNIEYDHHNLLHRQLLYNNQRKLAFCLVAKCGNTNTKRLFEVVAGTLSLDTVSDPRIDYEFVREHIYSVKKAPKVWFGGDTLDLLQSQYFKMTIVRAPLDRLVSAYRDKLTGPLHRPTDDKIAAASPTEQYRNGMQLSIFQTVHPQKYREWLKNDELEYEISFTDFIQHIISVPNIKLNHHYVPVINICAPCVMKYDYYGNFENYYNDAQILISKLGTKPEYLSGESHIHNRTTDLVKQHYSQLSQDLKEQLFKKWYPELEF